MRRVIKRAGVALAAACLGVLCSLAALLIAQPSVVELANKNPARTSFMEAAAREKGIPADTYSVHWTNLDQISAYVGCALIKGEDDLFFRHSGFDWREIWLTLRSSSRAGASSITQELARNLYLSPKRSWLRKLREAFLAWALERALTKRRILELYLNVIEWGDGVWGIGDASAYYHQKPPAELDAFDASFLAGLVPSPRRSLAGPNGLRAYGWQLRTLHYLFLAGLIDAGEELESARRAQRLFGALQSGVPFDQARAAASPPIAAVKKAPLTWARALSTECGLDAERAAHKLEKAQRR